MNSSRLLIATLTLCSATSLCACTSPNPVLPASRAPVVESLTLDSHRVVSGDDLSAIVTFTNTTNHVIVVQSCARNQWLFVGLVNGSTKYEPATTTIACAPTVRLTPGRNTFAVTIHTGPEPCAWGYSPRTPSGCPDPRAWVLPPGQYSTKVIVVGLPTSSSKPPALRVVVEPYGRHGG